MEMPLLPLEILIKIAMESPETFARMLALRPVVEFIRLRRKWVLEQFTIVVRNEYGIEYRIGGRLHREDGPAVKYAYGKEVWCRKGMLHRDGDLPAFICSSYKSWHQNGIHHRDGDQPATEFVDGTRAWYWEGKLHRDNGPAYIYANGTEVWYREGKLIEEN